MALSLTEDDRANCCEGALFGGSVLLILTISLFMCSGCDSTYSEGDREGYVQKLSHKGFFNKTWEGELAMQGLRQGGDEGALSGNIFEFSVDDGPIVQGLQDVHADQLVRLHYRQVWWSPWWKYFTTYRITELKIVEKGKREGKE